MQIKVLGCSGGVGPDLRTTSLLVDEQVLIDAGTGVCDLDLAEMSRITDIFLTHTHLDHIAGLAFMADNLFDLIDRPVKVHGTAVTLATLREHFFNWKIWPDFSKLPDEKNPIMAFHEIATGQPRQVNDFTLTAFPVFHTVPCNGYALQSAQGLFAFTGDTYANDEVWQALNALPRLDKLMIDVAFTDDDDELARVSRHFTPQVLARDLPKLKHAPQLLLTHHKPGCEADIVKDCRRALKGRNYLHLKRGDVIVI